MRAFAKMTPERMNTIIEALFRIDITFLTKYCPQKPAKTDTPIKYKAEKKEKFDHIMLKFELCCERGCKEVSAKENRG